MTEAGVGPLDRPFRALLGLGWEPGASFHGALGYVGSIPWGWERLGLPFQDSGGVGERTRFCFTMPRAA